MLATKKVKKVFVPKPVVPKWEIYYRETIGHGKMSMFPVEAETPEKALEKFVAWAKGTMSYYEEGIQYWVCPAPVLSGLAKDK